MRLILTLTEGGAALPDKDKARTMSSSGAPTMLTIGRGSDNGWMLPNPERTLSRKHCSIGFADGHFVLTDHSQSGIVFNGGRETTEPESRTTLKDGDEFRLGSFAIAVTVVDDSPLTDFGRAADRGRSDDFARQGGGRPEAGRSGSPAGRAGLGGPGPLGSDPLGSDPLGSDPLDERSPARPLIPVQHPIHTMPQAVANRRGADPFSIGQPAYTFPTEPVSDAFARNAAPGSDDWQGPSRADHATPLSQSITPARVKPGAGKINFDDLIGDVDLAGGLSPAPFTPPAAPPARPPAAIPPEIPVQIERPPVRAPIAALADSEDELSPRPPPHAPPAARAHVSEPASAEVEPRLPAVAPSTAASDAFAGLAAFLDGAGIAGSRIKDDDPEAALRAAGKIFRAMTEGFRQVLLSRAAVKGDMGIEQTMIAGTGNNALKFSVTTDDAVRLLLSPGSAGYMAPLEAAKEAAADIVSHELAVMAGMQTALVSLLRRFDPDELEKRMSTSVLGSVLPAARKARYWEAFRLTFEELSREAEDEFQGVFGRPFAKAYTAQTRKG